MLLELCAAGVVFMVAGIAAGAQLDKLKTSLQSKAVLREVFDAADVDESGALDSTELADLCVVREKRPFLRHFMLSIQIFAKTGSGQTYARLT